MSVRVAIADDHCLVAESLKTMLERRDPSIEVVHLATDGTGAVEGALRLHPDVVLMDLRMPGMDGVSAIRTITDSCPDIQVLALTTFEDDDLVFGALDAGAGGYLLKDISSEDLVRSVHQAARGEASLSPKVASKVIGLVRGNFHRAAEREPSGAGSAAAAPRGAGVPAGAELTRREIDVVRLVARGYSTAEIAGELCISVGTVKNHINAIYQILDVHSRAELVLYAVERGLGPAR